MNILKYMFLTFLLIVSFLGVQAQTISYLDSLKQEHKGNNVIILKDYDKITIDIKGENLVVKREVYKRQFYTNNKAQAYSKDQVSASLFKVIDKIEAYTEVREKNKYKKIKTKKIEENKYIDNQIFFQDDITYDFIYPSLREDAISNLKYTYERKDAHLLNGNFFQSSFPIDDIEFIVDVDENIDIGFVKFNFDSIQLDSSVVRKKHRIIYTYRAKKIKEIEFDDMQPPLRFVLPHIIPYIKSYRTKTQTVNVLRNPDDLYKWYKSLLSDVVCDDIKELQDKAKEIVAQEQTEVDKVKAIFKWVQKNIKYIAVEVGIGGFIPDCASNVYKNKYGDCKGMANILYHMLKAVDIESHLTWIGTMDLPYRYEEIPTPVVDNHMILTYIDKNNKYYYLDATGPNVIFGFPSSFIQGKEAMISKGDDYEIRVVPTILADMNQQNDSIYISIDENTIKGEGKIRLLGYFFTTFRNRTSKILEEKKLAKFMNGYLERGNNKFIVQKAQQKINEEDGYVDVNYDFTIGNYISRGNNQIFINMNIFKSMLNKKIKEDRVFPMKFEMSNSYKYYLKLKIPEGYKVEHLPKNVSLENEIYKLTINYTKEGDNFLVYELYSHYDTLQLNKEDFDKFNEFIVSVSKNFREVVILKKIE